ncbi:hypothetical protein [Mammaliicoccus sciuri]|uniref:hypothetical protein n=1 Tax=Mammaliicoccus sciuri TaxID=1296 RepID=UPI0015C4AD97|nr:hypothetical protein [Mammaliicoccus sciuri]
MKVSGNGFKNGHLKEIGILIKDETHLVVSKTLIATGDADAVDSDAYIAVGLWYLLMDNKV